MSNCIESTLEVAVEERSTWPAVVSLALGVFGLVTAELLPASLLTPMASGLAISEALAGQAVSATAIVALFAALLSGVATRGLDRRHVLVGFSVLLVVSNLLVAAAPNVALLMLARALLGIALGGFWSMATAIAIRLVPSTKVPRALSIMFSGLSLAAIVAIPLGSYLGGIYGWRNVFMLAAGLGVATAIYQMVTLPRLPPEKSASVGRLLGLFGQPGVALGILAITLVFGGHFGLFTYVRPFLEHTSQAGYDGIAATLMWFGIANFIGTLLAGAMLTRSVRFTLTFMPLVIAASVLGLVGLHGGSMIRGLLVALWGLAYGAVPVAWSTWMAQAVPEDTEAGGGLMVAAVQLAITLGVAGGGLIYSQAGVVGVFLAGGALLLLTSGLIAWKVVAGRTP